MTKNDEECAARLIAQKTGLTFSRGHFTLDGWGTVDAFVLLKSNRYLFLEVEKGQHHSCTNVLKVWPYLERNPQVAVVLAQAFFHGSRGCNSSRAKLGCWIGQQIEKTLKGRFWYRRLVIASDSSRILEGLDELLQSLKYFN